MFESTLPFGTPDLIRASAFERYLEESVRSADGDGLSSRLSTLSPSLAEDLMRFEHARRPGDGLEVLEVLAACVRHARSLLIHLRDDNRVIPLTVYPYERLIHCPVRMDQLLAGRLTDLQVLHIEPAVLRPLGDPDSALVDAPEFYAPLDPLLWELALRGARGDLLPEIAGVATYRVTPGADLDGLDLVGTLAAAVQRLRLQTTPLREIAGWPGFDHDRSTRMLNGLYLQSALIVSRSHPGAVSGL